MARTSETREKVRRVAEQLSLAGKPIASRRIREILGAGSLSTITDELAKWEAERLKASGIPATATATAAPAAALLLKGAADPVTGRASTAAPRAPDIDNQEVQALIAGLSEGVSAQLQDLRVQLDALNAELGLSRKSNEQQLAIAYQRYEAVQRHAMVQIDEARQVATELRQRLASVTLDFETRDDAQRGKLQSLRDENVRLSAQVQLLRELKTPFPT